MSRLAAFRPHRRHALPFVVAFAPLVWFIARDVSATTPQLAVVPVLRFVGLASAAAVASYLLAVLAVELDAPGPNSSRTSALPDPDGATLAVFGGLVAAGFGYVALSTFVAVPWWFDLLVAPVGVVVGLPLVALYGGFVAVANAVPALQRGLAPFVVVGVGVAGSVLWTYLLASILAEKLGS